MTEDKESLIAYCGLYCGDCPILKSGVADLAKELLAKLEESKFERWGPGISEVIDEFRPLSDFKQGIGFLNALDMLRCDRTCRKGGGTESCKIRICCVKKNLEGCWLCEEFETCSTLDWLKPVNRDSHLINLRIIRDKGKDKFLEGEKYW